MMRPVRLGLSPIVERFFGVPDQDFGLPKRICCDNSREVLSVVALEALIREQIEALHGALPPSADADVP